jgi:hypothetical protein
VTSTCALLLSTSDQDLTGANMQASARRGLPIIRPPQPHTPRPPAPSWLPAPTPTSPSAAVRAAPSPHGRRQRRRGRRRHARCPPSHRPGRTLGWGMGGGRREGEEVRGSAGRGRRGGEGK